MRYLAHPMARLRLAILQLGMLLSLLELLLPLLHRLLGASVLRFGCGWGRPSRSGTGRPDASTPDSSADAHAAHPAHPAGGPDRAFSAVDPRIGH